MSDHAPTPLSPRHERFVLEYLKDNNATQAYIRAGYSARGAQPSASKLLRDPRIAAAVGAGRQRIADALEVDVTRLAQEYAKIAFANVADYVSTDAAGHLRIDLEKASLAQQAGILELRLSNHRNPEKGQITLKLGKLQALKELTKNIGVLGRKPAPGLTEEDRQRYEERHAADRREVESSNERYWSIQEKLSKVEAALARAECEAARSRQSAAVEAKPAAVEPAEQAAAPEAEPATPCASGKKPIPRSPQEADSLMDMARWASPGGPVMGPMTDADYERLLKRGELSSYEAMKYLLRRR